LLGGSATTLCCSNQPRPRAWASLSYQSGGPPKADLIAIGVA
jgi:hypothetical protein